jgi:hypothetical protein
MSFGVFDFFGRKAVDVAKIVKKARKIFEYETCTRANF